MTIIVIMLVFILCGIFLCWCCDLWPFNPYTKDNYERMLKYLKNCSYPYQEITYDVFVSAFPYLNSYARTQTTSDYKQVGLHIVVDLPNNKKNDVIPRYYIPYWEKTQRYILLFPDYKQHEKALAYMKEYRDKEHQIRIAKSFAERSSIDVLKYCQDAIQKDIEATQKKMADACEDIKEKVKEINNV